MNLSVFEEKDAAGTLFEIRSPNRVSWYAFGEGPFAGSLNRMSFPKLFFVLTDSTPAYFVLSSLSYR